MPLAFVVIGAEGEEVEVTLVRPARTILVLAVAVPAGGRVTVACLERNLLTLYKQYHVGKISLRYRLAEEVSKLGDVLGDEASATKRHYVLAGLGVALLYAFLKR